MDSSLTDFHTGTTNNHHSSVTVYQQEPALLFPRFYLVASRQISSTSSTPQPPAFLSRHTLTYKANKDGPKDSTMVSWLLKQPHSELSIREPFLEIRTTKTWILPSVGFPKNYKQANLNKYIPSHPTHYHQFQLKYLSQVSTLARSFSTHHPIQS